MKLTPGRLASFLRNPGGCRVILLYGDDVGMIRYRSEILVRAVAGTLDDPFLVTELTRDRLDRLLDESASVPLTVGRRVIRVRDATDAAAASVASVLTSNAQALVVLEAPGIAARSRLRGLLESSPDGVVIACHPEEGRTLDETIVRVLGAATRGVDQDARTWLVGQLGSDQLSTHAELEKLSLYAGPDGRVDLDMALRCVGDLAGLSLDDALLAATAGEVGTTDRALEVAMAEGTAPVGVLRAGLLHLQRLYRARLLMETGMSAVDAAKSARPPVHFRYIHAFTKALTLWPSTSLRAAMVGLSLAERNCKRTGAPDDTLSRHAIMTLARRAMAGR